MLLAWGGTLWAHRPARLLCATRRPAPPPRPAALVCMAHGQEPDCIATGQQVLGACDKERQLLVPIYPLSAREPADGAVIDRGASALAAATLPTRACCVAASHFDDSGCRDDPVLMGVLPSVGVTDQGLNSSERVGRVGGVEGEEPLYCRRWSGRACMEEHPCTIPPPALPLSSLLRSPAHPGGGLQLGARRGITSQLDLTAVH